MKLTVTTIQRETMDVISAHGEHEPYDGDWKQSQEPGWQAVAMRYIGVHGPHSDATAYIVRRFERFTTKRDGVLVAINGQPTQEHPCLPAP